MWLRMIAGFAALATLLPLFVFFLYLALTALGSKWLEATGQLFGLVGAVAVLSTARRVAGSGRWNRGHRNRLLLGGAGMLIGAGTYDAASSAAFEAKWSTPRRAAMRSTLRILASAESAYYESHGRFTSDTSALTEFEGSTNVRVAFLAADSSRWHARAEHRNTTRTCEMRVTRVATGFLEQGPDCTKRGQHREEFPPDER